MLFDYSSYTFYLCVEPIDMRSGARRLSELVITKMNEEPFSKCVFAFIGKNHKSIKLLAWDGNGFWMHSKVLYKGTYAWPRDEEEAKILVTQEDIIALFSGQDRWRKLKDV